MNRELFNLLLENVLDRKKFSLVQKETRLFRIFLSFLLEFNPSYYGILFDPRADKYYANICIHGKKRRVPILFFFFFFSPTTMVSCMTDESINFVQKRL